MAVATAASSGAFDGGKSNREGALRFVDWGFGGFGRRIMRMEPPREHEAQEAITADVIAQKADQARIALRYGGLQDRLGGWRLRTGWLTGNGGVLFRVLASISRRGRRESSDQTTPRCKGE